MVARNVRRWKTGLLLIVISLTLVGCDFFDLALMADDELTHSQTGLGDTLVLPSGTIIGWTGGSPAEVLVKAFDTDEIASGSVRSIGGSPYFEGITIANSGSNPALQSSLQPLSATFVDDFDVYGRFLIIVGLHVDVDSSDNNKRIYFSPPGQTDTQILTWWYVENSFSFTGTVMDESPDQRADLDLTMTQGWNMVLANISREGEVPSFRSIDTLPNFSWNVPQDP